jgi:hypothetical protein
MTNAERAEQVVERARKCKTRYEAEGLHETINECLYKLRRGNARNSYGWLRTSLRVQRALLARKFGLPTGGRF